MIQLTRLRHNETFYLNPDLFERVDTHVDTVIRLMDGTEYVVTEPADEIVRRIAEFRAQIIAFAAVLRPGSFTPGERLDESMHATVRVPAALPPPAGHAHDTQDSAEESA